MITRFYKGYKNYLAIREFNFFTNIEKVRKGHFYFFLILIIFKYRADECRALPT